MFLKFFIYSFSFLYPLNSFCQIQDIFVNGYLKKDGSHILPYYRTIPNQTMLDNYSTKGNYNPYTGKPGWIDPYSKLSHSYYSTIPKKYQNSYVILFDYLNQKDSFNYYKIINQFDYNYKLFFTGLFNIQKNRIDEAYKIFNKLINLNNNDKFINSESDFWLELTSNYIDATTEFDEFYEILKKYESENNYLEIFNRLRGLKNPLNFHDKYLIKADLEFRTHRYKEAKDSYDSLIYYTTNKKEKDSLISGREYYFYGMNGRIDYKKTLLNNTYDYTIEYLLKDLIFFIVNNAVPKEHLKDACFRIAIENCTEEDTTLIRTLIDTSLISNAKSEFLSFVSSPLKNKVNTLKLIKFIFTDSAYYDLYLDELNSFKVKRPSSKSLAYRFENPVGYEFLISDHIIGGLVKRTNSSNFYYELYLYGFVNSEGLVILSELFK